MLADDLTGQQIRLTQLKEIISAGDELVLTPSIKAFCVTHPGCQILNHYGPTETHVVTSHLALGHIAKSDKKTSPIGKPIINIQALVLANNFMLLPKGVAGELFIGGKSLAREYLNQAALTAEKFIVNPFYEKNTSNSSALLYRTGDLVRWLPDGNLEFLGRIDHQVKIRGFRIELGEIEHQLFSHDEVNDAVVLALSNDEGDKHLVAYVTHDNAPKMLAEDDNGEAKALRHSFIEALKTSLGQHLPYYMVPSVIVVLEQLSLTPNGKVDRKGLPAPDMSLQQQSYVAPTTETEKLLCEIWQEVLGLAQVGITDNFFALGGHSLLATKLLIKINKAFDINLSVKQLFTQQTVSELYPFIDSERILMNGINAVQNNQTTGKSEETVWEI
jgi:acyl-coenzyme A synthetase/AMP-(fatty) acid ligase/acyl carrier protein